MQVIESRLMQNISCHIALPMTMGGLLNQAYSTGQVDELEYTEDAIRFTWSGYRETLPQALMQYEVQDEAWQE